MSVPKYFEMHKPTLKFLSDGKVHSAREIKEYLIDCFHLSGEDIMLLVPSGRTTYLSNRAGWARTYLKKAGLIESPSRGKFIITAEGRKALSESPDVIDSDYLMKYDSFREFQSMTQPYDEGIQKGERDVSETPDDILERAFKQINDNLADEILSEVMKLSPAAFEKMVMDLMSKMGYGTFENAAFTTCVTGDEGMDGIIMEDKLGFNLIYSGEALERRPSCGPAGSSGFCGGDSRQKRQGPVRDHFKVYKAGYRLRQKPAYHTYGRK